MDMYSVYMPEALYYNSARSPYFRDYEKQPLENIWKTCDKKVKQQKQSHNHSSHLLQSKQQKKESCPFCKEEKRRPLGAYLRSKGNADRKDIITEEEQDQEPEEQVQEDQGKGKK